jgi:paxillin
VRGGREGNPFCESCLYGIFSSRCGACDQPIKADTVNACGKQYHPECFVCAHCRRAFAGQPYFEYGGRPYCQLHYHSQIGATCGCGCGRYASLLADVAIP